VKQRRDDNRARRRLLLSALALLITAGILAVIIVERFLQGGIITLAITSVVVVLGLLIRRHYGRVRELTHEFEREHRWRLHDLPGEPPAIDPSQPTAVFLVSSNRGVGLHTVERVEALFPGISAITSSSASARWTASRSGATRRCARCSTRRGQRSIRS